MLAAPAIADAQSRRAVRVVRSRPSVVVGARFYNPRYFYRPFYYDPWYYPYSSFSLWYGPGYGGYPYYQGGYPYYGRSYSYYGGGYPYYGGGYGGYYGSLGRGI